MLALTNWWGIRGIKHFGACWARKIIHSGVVTAFRMTPSGQWLFFYNSKPYRVLFLMYLMLKQSWQSLKWRNISKIASIQYPSSCIQKLLSHRSFLAISLSLICPCLNPLLSSAPLCPFQSDNSPTRSTRVFWTASRRCSRPPQSPCVLVALCLWTTSKAACLCLLDLRRCKSPRPLPGWSCTCALDTQCKACCQFPALKKKQLRNFHLRKPTILIWLESGIWR